MNFFKIDNRNIFYEPCFRSEASCQLFYSRFFLFFGHYSVLLGPHVIFIYCNNTNGHWTKKIGVGRQSGGDLPPLPLFSEIPQPLQGLKTSDMRAGTQKAKGAALLV